MLLLLGKHFRIIMAWGLIFGACAGLLSALIPLRYSAVSTVLIINRDTSSGDSYTQTKAAEGIAGTVARIMQTEDFYNKVIGDKADFDRNQWQNLDARARQKKWSKNVAGSVVYGTGLLEIRVYSSSVADALKFGSAVTQAVVDHGFEYVGGDAAFKIVDTPVSSPWQTRPNLVLNVVVGFVLGLVLASVWVVRYKRHQLLSHL